MCRLILHSGKFSSPVQFYIDRCKYAFHHPKKDRIDMEMFYKDMVQSSCDDKKRAFVFKIGRQLEHFPFEYEPNRSDHFLSIAFSRQDYISFKSRIFPLVGQGR
mmetsp:Transcript_28108/g.63594  ORF Transcript_28108/g.63594 Transcript_28108/m.63594 type:complete len:104 (-) Transcript_28108:382-693(-)